MLKWKTILVLLLINLSFHVCNGQINPLDSCGLDANPILNQYEIRILDSLFFSSWSTKKQKNIDPSGGFGFAHKKIAFYSCTKNSNTNGLLSKKEFFGLCKPNFKGHAGRGIIIFTEKEKAASKGFDAMIIIDCPYTNPKMKDIILQLIKKND
jgi:hypothetical protein